MIIDMHYFDHIVNEPEPEFSDYETYYFTSFDSSYSDAGPYGEPLQFHQEGLPDESHFFSMQDEAEDGFLSRAWYSNGPTDQQQGYDTIESPYNDSGTWLDGYGSYLVTCWGESLLPRGYSYSGYEAESGSPEKADNAYSDEAYNSFSQDMQRPAYNDDHWHASGFVDFAYGMSEHYHDHGSEKPQTAYDNSTWSETRLLESILGHWPCLVRLDQESQAAISHQ